MKQYTMGRHAGLTIADAPFTVRMWVDSLDGAVTGDSKNCVLAQTVAQHCGAGTEVSFGASVALIKLPGETVTRRYILSPATQRAIKEFDNKKVWKPGWFEFQQPTGTRVLGYVHPPRRPNTGPRRPRTGRYGVVARRTPSTRHMTRPGVPTSLAS